MTQFIINFLHKHPAFNVFLACVGALRLIVKPIMTGLHMVAEKTATTWDDNMLAAIEQSKVWQALLYAMDWLLSISLN